MHMRSWDLRRHIIYLAALLFLSIFFIGICILLYDGPFTFRDVCISNLGNPLYNPRGWWVFSLGMCLLAVLIIPHVVYLYKRVDFGVELLRKAWFLLVMVGVFGMFMVGIVNETNYGLHIAFAAFAFGGYGLAMILSILVMIIRVIRGKKWPDARSFSVLLVLLLGFLMVIVSEILKYGINNPADLNFTEWMAFFLILTWIYGLTFVGEESTSKD